MVLFAVSAAIGSPVAAGAVPQLTADPFMGSAKSQFAARARALSIAANVL